MSEFKLTSPRPPRPRIAKDDKLQRLALEKIVSQVVGWLNEDHTDEKEVEDALVKAIGGRTWQDGYRLARELEHVGYDPDSDLVEILDDVSWALNDMEKRAWRDWVQVYGIELALPVGSRIQAPKTLRHKHDGLWTIVALKADTAQYGIAPGEQVSLSETGFYTLPAEEVELLVAQPAENPA